MQHTHLLVAVVLACCTIVLATKHVHFKIHVPVIKKEIHHEKVIYKHINKHNHKESHYDHHHHHDDEGYGGFGGHEVGFGGHDEGYGGDEGGYGGYHGGFGGDEGGYGGHEGGGYEDHGEHHVEYSNEGGHGWDEK